LSSQTLLDLRLSHAFDFAGKGRVELLLDVLNALDSKAEERLADDNLFSQNFARAERVRRSAPRDGGRPIEVSDVDEAWRDN